MVVVYVAMLMAMFAIACYCVTYLAQNPTANTMLRLNVGWAAFFSSFLLLVLLAVRLGTLVRVFSSVWSAFMLSLHRQREPDREIQLE